MTPSTRRFRSSFDWFEPVTPKPPNSAASDSPFPEEDRIATLKPSEARRRAAAAPTPLPPAVTIATFPLMAPLRPESLQGDRSLSGVDRFFAQRRIRELDRRRHGGRRHVCGHADSASGEHPERFHETRLRVIQRLSRGEAVADRRDHLAGGEFAVVGD